MLYIFFFFQAEDGIRDSSVTGVQTCAFRSEALSRELTARVNDLSARGARRLVIAVSGSDGADGEARAKGCTLVICSARSRCWSPRNWAPTPYALLAPSRACPTRSCTRPLSA